MTQTNVKIGITTGVGMEQEHLLLVQTELGFRAGQKGQGVGIHDGPEGFAGERIMFQNHADVLVVADAEAAAGLPAALIAEA